MKKTNNKHAEMMNDLTEQLLNGSIDIPDNAAIFLDPVVLAAVFTKKRLELIRTIKKNNPQSIQELANLTKRTKQAVDRDVKYLEGMNILELRSKGKAKVPKVKAPVLLVQLVPVKKKELVMSGVC